MDGLHMAGRLKSFQGAFTFLKHSCSIEEWYPKHFSSYGVWNAGKDNSAVNWPKC